MLRMMAEKSIAETGGYDCNYVDKPPKAYECPICLMVLRDPHMVDCCGRKYCQTCIETVQESQKPCPVCNCAFKVCILEKQLQREIGDVKVYCSNASHGCEWSGELRELQEHQQSHCSYTPLQCSLGCGDWLQRADLQEHIEHKCKNRSVQAQLNSCVVLFEKRFKEQDEIIARQKALIEQQAQEIAKLSALVSEQKEKLENIHLNTVLPRYSAYLNAMNEFWYSPPFYTSESGYKLRLRMHTTHRALAPKYYKITLSVELLQGDNDGQLDWPVNITTFIKTFCHFLDEESEIHQVELKQVERPDPDTAGATPEWCVKVWKKYGLESSRQSSPFYAQVGSVVIGFAATLTVLKTTVTK